MKDLPGAAMLADAYQAVSAAEQWSFFRDQTPPADRGYMFWTAPELKLVEAKMRDLGVHSGSSYGWTMRQMQAIAKRGWPAWVAAAHSGL
jgi:hypothetical protein